VVALDDEQLGKANRVTKLSTRNLVATARPRAHDSTVGDPLSRRAHGYREERIRGLVFARPAGKAILLEKQRGERGLPEKPKSMGNAAPR